MAISFGSAPGLLFPRLGKCGLILKQVRTYHNSQYTNFTDATNGLVAQFTAEPDIQASVGGGYLGGLAGAESAANVAKTVAAQTINRIVYRDNPRLGQTLTSLNTVASLAEIIRQMKIAGASVLAMTITATPTQFDGYASNTGNAVIVTSIRRPFDGQVLENAFAETVLIQCSSDSYSGGATAGNESLVISGTGNQSDFFAFNWPLGSNCRVSATVINGDTNNSSGNLLQDGGFTTWATTANVPDSWTLFAGTAGVDTLQESTLTYSGVAALKIVGDGVTNVELRQLFNSSTGTTATLSSSQQYAVCIFLRRDGVAAGAGTLKIELIDSAGNVFNDNNAVANSFSIDLTALTTNYGPFTGVFRTPEVMPTTYSIRLKLTPLTSGRAVYLDKMSLGLMSQLYTSGPFISVHAGSDPLITGDYATVAVTNSRGSGGTLDTFQTLAARLFPDMINSELLFPSSSTPTISDSALIA